MQFCSLQFGSGGATHLFFFGRDEECFAMGWTPPFQSGQRIAHVTNYFLWIASLIDGS